MKLLLSLILLFVTASLAADPIFPAPDDAQEINGGAVMIWTTDLSEYLLEDMQKDAALQGVELPQALVDNLVFDLDVVVTQGPGGPPVMMLACNIQIPGMPEEGYDNLNTSIFFEGNNDKMMLPRFLADKDQLIRNGTLKLVGGDEQMPVYNLYVVYNDPHIIMATMSFLEANISNPDDPFVCTVSTTKLKAKDAWSFLIKMAAAGAEFVERMEAWQLKQIDEPRKDIEAITA